MNDLSWCGEVVENWRELAVSFGWSSAEEQIEELALQIESTRADRKRVGRELYHAVGKPIAVLFVSGEAVIYRDASGQVGALAHPASSFRGWSASSLARKYGIADFADPPRGKAALDGPAHHCHAKGCRTRCAPECLMCPDHWRKVPPALQRAVYAAYRPGQCDDKSPSVAWCIAADAAIAAVARWPRVAPAEVVFATVPAITPAPAQEILWIDTETTGLSAECQVIELGVAVTDCDGNYTLEPASVLVALEPWSQRSIHAKRVHGIDWDSAWFRAKAQPMRTVFERLFQRACGKRIAGHNVAFDLRFIAEGARRVGLEVPAEFGGTPLCTLALAKSRQRNGALAAPSCGLEALCKAFGIPHTAHRAKGDVAAAVSVFRTLRSGLLDLP